MWRGSTSKDVWHERTPGTLRLQTLYPESRRDEREGLMATIEEVPEAARLWAAQQERAKAKKRRDNRINYTDRAKEYIAAGMHPVTGLPLLGAETCGSCAFAIQVGGHARDYWKCSSQDGRFVTRSEASDIRLKWPACNWWRQKSLLDK